MEAIEALVILNMLEHVGSIRLKKCLEHFGEPASILSASLKQLESIPGLGRETSQAIVSWEKSVDWKGEFKRIKTYGCEIRTWSDPDYPKWLLEIPDPPPVLYVSGRMGKWTRNSIAVVGSRRATPYGKRTAFRFGKELAALSIAVISGGARGIDTEAHRGALKAASPTLAVLGTGINRIFPPENKKLFDEIKETGAVITQFPFNQFGHKQSFPIRNRIVAGMSLGTLVVEAPRQSGALITANMAVDFGRQVFAVPGPIDSPASSGCHELIRNGARICDSVRDILEELEYLLPKPMDKQMQKQGERPSTHAGLNEDESKIVSLLTETPVQLDWIIRQSGMTSSRVLTTLFGLEMKKRVVQSAGKHFTLFQGHPEDK